MNLRKTVVVVEIGNDWIKIAQNNVSLSGGCITGLKFIKLAQIKEPVSFAIAKAFEGLKLQKKSVITYIPRNLVNARILELPSTDRAEIKNIINLQVNKQTPYSKEEIVYAHKILDIAREGYSRVMLIIAKRNIISERIETLHKAGIEVEKVALSSEGVYNWFNIAAALSEPGAQNSQNIVLIDIDSNCSDFIAIHGGKMVFTRNIFIGANHLLSEDTGWKDRFVDELKRTIERYRNEEKGAENINKIFLSGAAKNINNLDAVLSAQLGIPAENMGASGNIDTKKCAAYQREDGHKFISTSALFGLATAPEKAEIDLTPGEIRIRQIMEAKRKDLTVTGILLTSIVMVASFLFLTNIYYKNAYLAQLKSRIAGIRESAESVARMRMVVNAVKSRLDAKDSSINILAHVYELTPEEIYFTTITVESKQKVILRGRAPAMSDVFKFLTQLENSRYFENVKTTYTTTKKEKDKECAEFEITCMCQKG
ncbi:MAG: pilus assembly protein PilM [Candidatus Omnitrophica bacterium]|nr:pilus assembly protein PilM [Candidatus Omnitrophota bacterium]